MANYSMGAWRSLSDRWHEARLPQTAHNWSTGRARAAQPTHQRLPTRALHLTYEHLPAPIGTYLTSISANIHLTYLSECEHPCVPIHTCYLSMCTYRHLSAPIRTYRPVTACTHLLPIQHRPPLALHNYVLVLVDVLLRNWLSLLRSASDSCNTAGGAVTPRTSAPPGTRAVLRRPVR